MWRLYRKEVFRQFSVTNFSTNLNFYPTLIPPKNCQNYYSSRRAAYKPHYNHSSNGCRMVLCPKFTNSVLAIALLSSFQFFVDNPMSPFVERLPSYIKDTKKISIAYASVVLADSFSQWMSSP